MRPGTTISLTSVASFPTAVREMEQVISTGFSRAGAAIGMHVFTPIQAAAGKASTFYVDGGIRVLETSVYCFLPEAKAVDPEVMDEQFERYLREEGYTDKIDG